MPVCCGQSVGGEYAPIGTQRPWRLALTLLCLLLALPSYRRLCRRPPVAMRWIHVLGFTRRAGDKAACVAGSVVALSCIERISLCWSSWEARFFEGGLLGVVWLVTGTRSPAVDQEQKRGWSWHGGPSRAIRASTEDGTAAEMYATGSNESKRTIAKGQAGDDASAIDTGSRQGPQIGATVGPEGGGRKSISASSSRATRPSALSEMPHAEATFPSLAYGIFSRKPTPISHASFAK